MPDQKPRYFIGLMSGTSVDSIDAALIELTGKTPKLRARVLHHHERPWPNKLRQRILAIMAPATTATQELCQLHVLIAKEFATAAMNLLAHAKFPAGKITALASHGQTVCHLPPRAGDHTPSTLQLGDPSVIATLTGIQTVGNFRPADMALGGQGAPLVPFADDILFSHPTEPRCIQNIGGIANVTYIPPLRRTLQEWKFFTPRSRTKKKILARDPILAFDTGPGNMLMDAIISLATKEKKHFDKNGHIAARGLPDPKLLRKLQSLPYFAQKPPKSTGRELFGAHVAQFLLTTKNWKLETLLSTATHLTAWSIAHAYKNFLPALPRQVILCGGGAYNPTLTRLLESYLNALRPPEPITLRRIDEFGIPNKSKEAASFAILAAATLDGVPAGLPSVTGASRTAVLGVIARP